MLATAKMASSHTMAGSMHVCVPQQTISRSTTEVGPLLPSVLNSVHALTHNGLRSYASMYRFLLSFCEELAIALCVTFDTGEKHGVKSRVQCSIVNRLLKCKIFVQTMQKFQFFHSDMCKTFIS